MSREKAKKDTSTRTLHELGLGENEATLYNLMLSRPRSTVQELNIRAPFPRTMLYYVLKQLMTRGLVSTKKDRKRTVYIAENPERLYELLAEKEREFDREKTAVRKLIPHLKQRYRLAGERPSVRLFEGVVEYQKALEDIIISNPKEILSYEQLGGTKPALEVRDLHESRRVARKIKKNVLFFEHEAALRFLRVRRYDDFTQFRGIAHDVVEAFAIDLTLYDGKMLYTSYYDGHEPTAMLIEDHALFLMQKNMFLALWTKGKDRTLLFTEHV